MVYGVHIITPKSYHQVHTNHGNAMHKATHVHIPNRTLRGMDLADTVPPLVLVLAAAAAPTLLPCPPFPTPELDVAVAVAVVSGCNVFVKLPSTTTTPPLLPALTVCPSKTVSLPSASVTVLVESSSIISVPD